MPCKFCDWDGICELWDKNGDMFEYISYSCDNRGCCLVEEDEDPSMSCEDYEDEY